MSNKSIAGFWDFVAEKAREAGRNVQHTRDHKLNEWASEMTAQLASIVPDLAVDAAYAAGGGLEVTITANGVLRHFARVREIAASAPRIAGLKVNALRPAKILPETIRFGAHETVPARLRIHAVPVMSRIGILLLTSGMPIDDYVLFRNLGRRLIMDVVGEERFGQYITDVQVMEHADWDAGAGEEESLPLADVTTVVPQVPVNVDRGGPRLLSAADEGRRVA